MAIMEGPLFETSMECGFIELVTLEDDSPPPRMIKADAFTTIETATTISSNNNHALELYDSGASCHMMPYHHLLENYAPTEAKLINAANKQTFCTISTGDLCITVPNSDSVTPMMLKNVLYTPDIAATLISIGCIDNTGYLTTFGKGECIICNTNNKCIGNIPINNGLYCVDHLTASETTNMVNDELTIMQFHS